MGGDWVIVGSGVQGRQIGAAVLAAAAAQGDRVLGYLDDDPAKIGKTIADLPVLGPMEWVRTREGTVNVAVALGQAGPKRAMVARLKLLGGHLRFPPIVHPFTSIGPRVILGEGVVIQAGSVLLCDLSVGDFTIIGASSTLGHDSRVGSYCFLSPGLRLAGYAAIGDDCVTGLNTCLINHISMGDRCTSGAGAVIIRNVEDGETVVGVPAHAVRPKVAATS